MKCEIIEDLLPLYIDCVCSAETREEVSAHLNNCEKCKKSYLEMDFTEEKLKVNKPASLEPQRFSMIRQWYASILQSILLLVSFGFITIGVFLENNFSPNGFYAGVIVVPFTAMLLTQLSYFFLHLYKNRRQFVIATILIQALFTLCGYAFAIDYYCYFVPSADVTKAFVLSTLLDLGIFPAGLIVCLVLLLTGFFFSNKFAQYCGKD